MTAPDVSLLPRDPASLDFDAIAALRALETKVIALAPDGRIVFGNLDAGGAPGGIGRLLSAAFPTIAGAVSSAIRAVTDDGHERSVTVIDPHPTLAGEYDVRVRVMHNGVTLLELREGMHGYGQSGLQDRGNAENEPGSRRTLARQISEVSDSHALLRVLAETARSECEANGVAIVQADTKVGTVLVALGSAAQHGAMRFELTGSLAERAIASREAVLTSDYPEATPRFRDAAIRMRVGPVAIAPLIAHGIVFGVLGVQRETGATPFSPHDCERLLTIADHVALVLWKARLFEEVRLANEAKSTFLATVSHELRTPLTALTGYGELLADQILGPMAPPQLEVVDRMRSVTHHLTMMIDEILTYSSLEAGREQVRTLPVNPVEVARAAAAIVEPLARQKNVEFRLEIPDALPAILSDPDKIRQILVNLAGNAVKFTDHGEVLLTLAADADQVHFEVRDTGIGISAEHFTRLFQPFTQIESGLTRRHGGTGLGLYISHRMAVLLGGEISVDSAVGAGTTFSLHLPLHASVARPPSSP